MTEEFTKKTSSFSQWSEWNVINLRLQDFSALTTRPSCCVTIVKICFVGHVSRINSPLGFTQWLGGERNWETCLALGKYHIQWRKPGFEPQPLDPDSSTLTLSHQPGGALRDGLASRRPGGSWNIPNRLLVASTVLNLQKLEINSDDGQLSTWRPPPMMFSIVGPLYRNRLS